MVVRVADHGDFGLNFTTAVPLALGLALVFGDSEFVNLLDRGCLDLLVQVVGPFLPLFPAAMWTFETVTVHIQLHDVATCFSALDIDVLASWTTLLVPAWSLMSWQTVRGRRRAFGDRRGWLGLDLKQLEGGGKALSQLLEVFAAGLDASV
jgi:hypothetical protein